MSKNPQVLTKDPRPLSPHIQIYRWQVGSIFSIIHRTTGMVMGAFLFYITVFLTILATLQTMGIQTKAGFFMPFIPYIGADQVFISCVSEVIILAFHYHFFNGIRYWLWHKNILSYEVSSVKKSAYWVLALSCLWTALMSFFLWEAGPFLPTILDRNIAH